MSESAKLRTQSGKVSNYIEVSYPNSTTEVYTYKIGGSGGVTVETITIVYTDSTKVDTLSVTIT